ncbi:hypothetical protein [Paraburkholderia sp. PGU19]|uniref:hypothetical protein n=1 Tax=Paraburkholderia sp. PGU19 TaxID=2735434 RepID=UPI0015DBBD86|nr:hypothetical protein [Paraburkholderia sp. PGU19]
MMALVTWQRAVKSPREIEYMRMVEKMYAHIVERIEPGMRKRALSGHREHRSHSQ